MKKIPFSQLSLAGFKEWIGFSDQKKLIKSAIGGGVFLIFTLFLLLPVLIQNKRLVAEVKDLKWKVDQADIKIARIPEMTRQKELFGERIKQIRERFFEAQEIDRLIEIISTQAAQTGVKISASRPASHPLKVPEMFAQMYVPASYDLVVEGSYHNLGSFLNSLERYSRNLTIHDLDIAAGENTPTTHQCAVTITAFVKYGEGV